MQTADTRNSECEDREEMQNKNDPLASIPKAIESLRAKHIEQQKSYRAITDIKVKKSKMYQDRINALIGLEKFLTEYEREIYAAIKVDLGKPDFEIFSSEIAMIAAEIVSAKRSLKAWMHDKSVSTFLPALPAKSKIHSETLGIVLIISPWNYPMQLCLSPLIGAIAAGNCAVLKPSEFAPHTTQLLKDKLAASVNTPEYSCVHVIDGAVAETQKILESRFDYIFYTGGPRGGAAVSRAAAMHFPPVPVTLELGGKSPCIIDENVNLANAAKTIVWGKFMNAGQTCIAPDYVLVHKNVKDQLIAEIKNVIKEFYGEDPKQSSSFGRIVQQGPHFQRLVDLIKNHKGKIECGGECDPADSYIAPTVVIAEAGDEIMKPENEIFGPILPILAVDCVSEAIEFVVSRPKPLAAYVFTNSQDVKDRVTLDISAGDMAINTTIMQVTIPNLPFGGVGASGYGKYHGQHSFELFSNHKGIYEKKMLAIDVTGRVVYPPYDGTVLGIKKETVLGVTLKLSPYISL